MSSFEERLRVLAGNSGLKELRRGIERESLRINADGSLSQQPHPAGLGAPLTHSSITTDFSEAQLELITGIHLSPEACYQELLDIHRFVIGGMGDELLWPASMPCGIGKEDSIPIAKYGRSHIARMKEIYRSGLAHRYGRVMQTISGIHYNFSLPDDIWEVLAYQDDSEANQSYRDEGYLRLTRNFRQHGWLLLMLFGASPMVCRSFLRNNEHNLQVFDETTRYLPDATSLRMGPLGYQSADQAAVYIDHNSLSGFYETLSPALSDSYPRYQEIGVKQNGHYLQINDALLQIEAEFYGSIRIKRKTEPRERALLALLRRGIEYVEVRCVDIDPFDPVGISVETMRFLDIFLIHSLLSENTVETEAHAQINLSNQLRTVHQGRDPNTVLQRDQSTRSIVAWADQLLQECEDIADMIDKVTGGTQFREVVSKQQDKLKDLSETPAARLQRKCEEEKRSFSGVGLELANQHLETLSSDLSNPAAVHRLKAEVERSNRALEELERSQEGSFEAFLEESLSLAEYS